MEAIKQARELGKVIQKDPRYSAYHAAKKINDEDDALNEQINEFNLLRQQLNLEVAKKMDERDKDKIEELNAKAQDTYTQIMENENMKSFTQAKTDMDTMINEVSLIISMCCDGEDPDTCDITPPETPKGCASGGGCSGCGKH
jgi:cell fate (sporulation/competence/biofilm development) regulator YlbF (YheA/YmcA/DUF963 family)